MRVRWTLIFSFLFVTVVLLILAGMLSLIPRAFSATTRLYIEREIRVSKIEQKEKKRDGDAKWSRAFEAHIHGRSRGILARFWQVDYPCDYLLQDIQQSNKQVDPSDPDYSGVAAQVHQLAMEVRQLALARPITVLNGDSGQLGSITSLAMPAAALGALGYGYMWWKGFSFSDLMYVTKRNMTTAVSSMTKHLEQVSAAIAATKKHLTQRIENLDGKLDEQMEISKLIKNEVTDVRTDLSQIGYDLETLQKLVCGLDGKINTLEDSRILRMLVSGIFASLLMQKMENCPNFCRFFSR